MTPHIITTASGDEIDLSRIGGSDAAVIVGLSPWSQDTHALWRRITTGERDFRETEAMRWGSLLESTIRDEVAERMECEIVRTPSIAPVDQPWLRSTADGELLDRGLLLEIKATGAHAAADWKIEIPPHYQCQAQWNLHAWNRHSVGGEENPASAMIFAVLFGGQRLGLYRLEYDHGVGSTLFDEAAKWYDKHVRRLIEPPRSTATSTGEVREATRDEAEAAGRLRDVDIAIGELKAEKSALEDQIRRWVGDDAGYRFEGCKVTVSAPRESTRTDWSAVVDAFRVEVGEAKIAPAIAAATKTGRPQRSLRVKWEK